MKLVINNLIRKFTYRKRIFDNEYVVCCRCNIKSCVYNSPDNSYCEPAIVRYCMFDTDIYPYKLIYLKVRECWRLYHETYY